MNINPALGVNLKDVGTKTLEKKRWRISEKVDGVRRLFYKSSMGDVKAFSRSGKADPHLSHITSYLEKPWFPHDRVYDCELVLKDMWFSRMESFILRSNTIGAADVRSNKNKEALIAICFDIFEPNGLETGAERNRLLMSCFSDSPLDAPVIMVPILGVIQGFNLYMIDTLMDRVVSLNGEGLMLMNLDEPYIQGRSNNLIKIKNMQEFVGTIIDVELAKSDTKIEGGVSTLICEVEGCTVPVRVGTGFSNQLRRAMAEDVDLIGKQIEIDAFNKTVDRYGNSSLSFPVFKNFLSETEYSHELEVK